MEGYSAVPWLKHCRLIRTHCHPEYMDWDDHRFISLTSVCLFFSQSFQSCRRPEGKAQPVWVLELTSVWTQECFGMVSFWTRWRWLNLKRPLMVAHSLPRLCVESLCVSIHLIHLVHLSDPESVHCALAKHQWVTKWAVCWMESGVVITAFRHSCGLFYGALHNPRL